jgi:hypothetical protein
MARANYNRGILGLALALAVVVLPVGCYNTPVNVSRGPVPLREPGRAQAGAGCSYEDSLQGHHVFEMYCAACHNARTLAERPFSNYQNVAQHMRVRANLTGEEYAKLLAWLRRWHDVPDPEQREESSPKRFFYSQPIPELRQEPTQPARDPVAGPRPGTNDEASPGQPPPGSSPREGR